MIVYTREENGHKHIWAMNFDGSKQKRLTSGAVSDDLPFFTSDGSHVFASFVAVGRVDSGWNLRP